MHNWKDSFWQYPFGVKETEKGLQLSFVSKKESCGIVLYEKKTGKELERYSFGPEHRKGNVYCYELEGIDTDKVSYLFYEEEKLIPDPYGLHFVEKDEFGSVKGPKAFRAGLGSESYDWEDDKLPKLSYEESIIYCMHVRGFTRHGSSGVNAKGTFAGVVEKIPYLRELGITTVELQPIYEFNEKEEKYQETAENLLIKERGEKLNYWGYRDAYYYAPKRTYAKSANPVREYKDMVKAFHQNGMEVIMQVFFPTGTPVSEMLRVIRFWHMVYHVDGFHLIGDLVQVKELAQDAFLSECKLWYHHFPVEELYTIYEKPGYRNLATYNDGYMYDMRRFLKGDEGMLYEVMKHMRINPATNGVINYLTNYHGFTMADLFRYDRKYNEDNGEDNKDGVDYNFSWNCGAEGITRKKQVMALREKQMRNAFTLLMLSQGTPLFFMGDEFGNSQKGNNNPYCQDNEITWLNWKDLNKNCELYDFVKELIAFRKNIGVFHLTKECMIMDYKSCGCPDISYHGEEAWKPNWEHYSRHMGFMLCGEYAKGCEGRYFYVAINMHWENHEFALPKLPKKKKWKKIWSTSTKEPVVNKEAEDGFDSVYLIEKRSITVFIGE